jgi:hypothetical protein
MKSVEMFPAENPFSSYFLLMLQAASFIHLMLRLNVYFHYHSLRAPINSPLRPSRFSASTVALRRSFALLINCFLASLPVSILIVEPL